MTSQSSILERVINASTGGMTAELARQILALDFPSQDHGRFEELSSRASLGKLTDDERTELEDYLNLNDFLTIMKARARESLTPKKLGGIARVQKSIDDQVRNRALARCEYCRIPQSSSTLRHVIDHIIAQQHGGQTVLENLALACGRCNLQKGPNIAGLDPLDGSLRRLFNPRTDRWDEHSRFEGAHIVGQSDVGRTTVHVLALNLQTRLAVRSALQLNSDR